MMIDSIRPVRQLIVSALLCLVALCAPLQAQDAPLAPYTAEYDVIRNGKTLGSSRVSLSRDGSNWRYDADTTGDRGMASLLGLKITQRMDFTWKDAMPQPATSDYDQQATLGSRTVNVRYDWAARSYRLTDRKGEHRHAIVDGISDRYGSGVSIAAKLAGGATDFTLPVAHADGIRDWRFRVAGRETVDTPSGPVDAVKVERVRDDADRTTISWHDPARDFLAVRLMQEEDGDTTETRLRSWSKTGD